MTRTPEELWQRLVDEAGEDLVEQFASMDAGQVEKNLAAAGFDLADQHAKAARFLEELASGALEEPTRAPVYVAEAVPQQAAPRFERSGPRRRPRVPVVWIAGGVAAAAVAGGALYVALREKPAPSPPAPAPPAPAPTESAPQVDLVAAADLRERARDALAAGRARACLDLLDRAAGIDPAGNTDPAVTLMREDAARRLRETPEKPEKPLKPTMK